VTPGMIDAVERVTGRIEYAMDVRVPGMLHAAVARSTHPHARILSVETGAAARVAGVRAVLRAEDIQRLGMRTHFGPILRDQPVLTGERVRYVGDAVVAIAAEDQEAAAEAAALVEIEYEPLMAVFGVHEALEKDAPLVHERLADAGPTFRDVVLNREPGTNVCNHFKIRKGDVEAALASAEHVFVVSFTTPPVGHVPFETHVCVAQVDPGGAVTLWDTTQTPYPVASQIAELLGIDSSQVRVIVPSLGGAYGAKCYPKIEPLAVALALATRLPVRFELTREECFVAVTKHGSDVELTTGLDGNGRIVARKTTCLFNTGAYADIGPRVIKNGGYGSPGPYAIPNVWVDSYAVYTNLPPAGAFRGYGQAQVAWAYESQMDLIAERLGIDPLELRLKNLLRSGDAYHTGERIHVSRFVELLQSSTEAIGWNGSEAPVRSGSRVRAKGFACAIKGQVTPSTSTAMVKLNEDGSLNVLTSSVEMGQGLKTALALIAATQLGIPIDRIRVSGVDTAITPYDQQTSASRSTSCMGAAVTLAVDDALWKLRVAAGSLLDAPPEDIRVEAGETHAGDRRLTLGEVVHGARLGNIIGHGRFQTEGGLDPETGQGVAAARWHQAAGAAEVEVDLETGNVEVLRYHAAVYAGRVVNPALAELQTHGNIAFGLGQALAEELVFSGGQLSNANLGEYMIPSAEDLPQLLSVDTLEDGGDAEIHGLGGTALPPVAPAIGNAVARAIGHSITSLPITPEKVLLALRGASAIAKGSGHD
jgi:CO/xanthine dehydrogenase Mo-binding subunit